MANCKEWLELNSAERILLIGQLVIAVQNDSFTFKTAQKTIALANINGVYEDTKIDNSNPAALADLDNPIENFTN